MKYCNYLNFKQDEQDIDYKGISFQLMLHHIWNLFYTWAECLVAAPLFISLASSGCRTHQIKAIITANSYTA